MTNLPKLLTVDEVAGLTPLIDDRINISNYLAQVLRACGRQLPMTADDAGDAGVQQYRRGYCSMILDHPNDKKQPSREFVEQIFVEYAELPVRQRQLFEHFVALGALHAIAMNLRANAPVEQLIELLRLLLRNYPPVEQLKLTDFVRLQAESNIQSMLPAQVG